MRFFYKHLRNHLHWIWIRLLEDAPNDPIHKHLTRIFDIGVCDSTRCYMQSIGEWEVN